MDIHSENEKTLILILKGGKQVAHRIIDMRMTKDYLFLYKKNEPNGFTTYPIYDLWDFYIEGD